MAEKKKKRGFPSAYTVIVIVLILVQALTFFIPSGKYSTLEYNSDSNKFVITESSGKTYKKPATQKTLDDYSILPQDNS